MNKQLLLNQTHQGQCLQAVMKQQSRLENLLLAQQSILNIIHRTLRESNVDPNAHTGLSTSLRTQGASQSDRLIVSQEGVDQRFTLKRDIIQKIFCQWIEKTKGTSLTDGHIALYNTQPGRTVWCPALIYALVVTGFKGSGLQISDISDLRNLFVKTRKKLGCVSLVSGGRAS